MDATVFDTGQSALCFERDSAQQSDPTNTLQLQGQGPEGPNLAQLRSGEVDSQPLPAPGKLPRQQANPTVPWSVDAALTDND